MRPWGAVDLAVPAPGALTAAGAREAAPNPGRRALLAGLLAAPIVGLAPAPAAAQAMERFWAQPRVLDIYRPILRKRVKTVYWQNGQVHMPGYHALCHALKDHRADVAFAMDLRLLDLLCAMQAWVAYYGFKDPIQINSGYRTARSNSQLEGAARNSMHLHGRAVDLVFPGLPTAYVGKLAAHYAGGGVGFYFDKGFIHVDTGRRRFWRKG